ncbi:MAG: ATP-binding cassette domain-containing protein [Microthrixaceae bacterium]
MYRSDGWCRPDCEGAQDISLSFYPGARSRHRPQRRGKSTLLRIMAGLDDGFTGEPAQPRVHRGHARAEPKLDDSKDVTGNVMDGVADTAKLLTDYDELMAGWADPRRRHYEALGAQQAELEAKIGGDGAWDLKRTVDIAMDALRLPPGDAQVSSLSGGEARRVALCRLLLKRPDLLLLDEPTNHLDAESVAWIERFLADYEGTVVAITHDRYFLDNVASWILELDHGKGMPFEGNYSGWLEQKQSAWPRRRSTPPPASAPWARAGVGAHGPQGPPGQEQGPAGRLRPVARRAAGLKGSSDGRGSLHPTGRPAG